MSSFNSQLSRLKNDLRRQQQRIRSAQSEFERDMRKLRDALRRLRYRR